MRSSMMELVTGGSGSGKSAYAENTLCCIEKQLPLYYIATMPSWDRETEKKIERHRAMRSGKGFCTLEWYTGLEGRLKSGDCPPMKGTGVLLECLSNLTANEMFETEGAGERTEERVLSGVKALLEKSAHLVIVTNDIFSDGITYDEVTALYQERLGHINRELAFLADQVAEVVCGIPLQLKSKGSK